MPDITDITNFEIFRFKTRTTEYVDSGAAIIKHNTNLPDGVTGNFFIGMVSVNGNPIEAYVPAGAATNTQLGTIGSPLQWQPSTGIDISGNSSYGESISAGTEIVAVVSKTLLLQVQKALLKEIGSSLKVNAPFSFTSLGITNCRSFVSEGARDIAFPDPADNSAYNGYLAIVGGVGLQYHNGTNWQTLGISSSIISSWKEPCLVATTENITLSGEQTIDGELTNQSRVLVWKQSNPVENGIYITDSGAWTRSSDFDLASEATSAAVAVSKGSTYADQIFLCTSNNPTIGADAITFIMLDTTALQKASTAEAQGGTEDTKYTTVAKIVDLLRGLASGVYTAFVNTRQAKPSIGDSDYILISDSDDSNRDKKVLKTNLTKIISRKGATGGQVTVTNTTAETNLLSFVLPAGTLSTNNAVKIKVFFDSLAILANKNVIFRLKYGSTTIASCQISMSAVANFIHAFSLDALLTGNGTTSSQRGSIIGVATYNGTGSFSASETQGSDSSGSAAENSNGDLTLSITAQYSDVGMTLVVGNSVAEIIAS